MIKSIVLLVVGLIVGCIGGFMFHGSLPPETPLEEQIATLQKEKAEAELLIKELENQEDLITRSPENAASQKARLIIDRIRRGETVGLEEFFSAYQPFLEDSAPLFGLLRNLGELERFDYSLGQLTRKYDLTDAERTKLERWMERKSRKNRRAFDAALNNPNATIFDFLNAFSNQNQYDEGIEEPLRDILDRDEFSEFRNQRLEERATRVQREADGKLKRLEKYVDLRPEQQDSLFVVFAQSSRHYSRDLEFEGIDPNIASREPTVFSYDSVYEVLDPKQTDQLRNAQDRERASADRRLGMIGLEVGPDWDMLQLSPYHAF